MLIFYALVPLTSALCVFTQDNIGETPHNLTSPTEAQQYNFTGPLACPMFTDQPTCCNVAQNSDMATRFVMIDLTMGSPSGGCDICAANMKLMWCYFTCSPNQADFVQAGPQEWVLDPTDPSRTKEDLVMLNNFTVTYATACSIYESCKKCPYVVEVSAMHSAQGFLNFQGYNSIEYGATWTTFFFEDTATALDLTFSSCNTNTTNLYGYAVKPCSCNNCEKSCKHSYSSSSSDLSDGLDWEIVWISYVALVGVSIGIMFFNYCEKRRKQRNPDPEPTPPQQEQRELREHVSSFLR
mmetsp:Transcript_9534/g.18514  ORF Transcript_9534/g.18514 Transcript_9534/m.18514 type:complete len:296 (-) Transcript_9534:60-947(-)